MQLNQTMCYSIRIFVCDVKKCHDHALKVRPFPIYIVSVCLPVALLEELHSATCSVSTGMPSSFNSFTGIVMTLKTSTLSIPPGRGVSKSTVRVSEHLEVVKLFASTCFLRTEAPSAPVTVMLYHLVGNKRQSGDTWGQEVGKVTCSVTQTGACLPPVPTCKVKHLQWLTYFSVWLNSSQTACMNTVYTTTLAAVV